MWERLAAQPVMTASVILAGLGGLSAAAVALAGWFWLADDLAAEAAQSQKLGSRLAQQRKTGVPDLAVLRQEQTDLAQAVSTLEVRWADPATAPALWLQVQAAALAQALKVDSFQPATPLLLADRVEQPATLRLKGRYAQVAGWVNALAADTPAVGVRRLSLQLAPDGLLLADVMLVRHQHLPIAATSAAASTRPGALIHPPTVAASSTADAWFDAASLASFQPRSGVQPARAPARAQMPSALRDPFAAPVVSIDAAPPLPRVARQRPDALQAWPLAQLRLAGVLAQPGQAVALVQVAGRTHAVRVGDGLGQDHGEVVRIDESGLVLREWVRPAAGPWTAREVRLQVGQGRAP